MMLLSRMVIKVTSTHFLSYFPESLRAQALNRSPERSSAQSLEYIHRRRTFGDDERLLSAKITDTPKHRKCVETALTGACFRFLSQKQLDALSCSKIKFETDELTSKQGSSSKFTSNRVRNGRLSRRPVLQFFSSFAVASAT